MREMKDSGVEWIGKIPKDWEIARIKNVTHRIIVGLATSVTQYYRENGTPILRNTNIYQYKLDDSDVLYLDPYWASKQFSKLIHTNDILTVHTGYIGESCLVPPKYNNCLTFTTLVSTANQEKILPKYLMCEINSSIGKSKIYFTTDTGAQNNLNVSDFANLEIVVPAIKEQERILNYLDSRSFDINKMIADIQSEIDMLEKYKRSVITEAVTKGLDKDVEMKDSGIEWIGKIPYTWNVGKIKFYVDKVGSGKTPKGDEKLYTQGEIFFLRSQNIFDTGIVLDEEPTVITDAIDAEMANTRVLFDDVLLNITGGSIGRCCIYKFKNRANVNQHVCIIRTKKDKILPAYMHYFWISNLGQTAINLYQTGGNREGMSADAIKNTPIPIMSIQEQKDIVQYLDDKCSNIDIAVSQKQEQLNILNDYKKSLIYEYVTGKKEVPSSWQN